MKIKSLIISLLCINTFAQDAQQLAKIVYHANQPIDMVQEVEMKLISSGVENLRKFVSILKTNNIENNNSIIQFTSPRRSRGVSLLTKNKVGKSADQYIYLPALKKVRRISSSKKSGRFVGSDIYYEDLQNRHYSKNIYSFLKKSKKHVILKSIPRDDTSIYSKVIMKIDLLKKTVIKTKLYINGKLDKIVYVKKLKKDGNIWFPTKVIYENKKIDHKTIITTIRYKMNKNISNKIFSKRSIEDERLSKSLFKK